MAGADGEQRRKFAPLRPDFVVELRSPSDALDELEAKMTEYIETGAPRPMPKRCSMSP